MEYQKIINFLDNTTTQASKFKTKNWVEVNEDARATYNTIIQIKLKNTMLMPSLRHYSDSYIRFKGTITITGAGADEAARLADERTKKVMFKNCTPFTGCVSEISNTRNK